MKTFASRADLRPKKISFPRLSKNCWAFTAEGDPNSGVIVGDDGVMVVDAQATPHMAREVIRRMDRVYSAYPIYEHCMPFDVSRAFDEARGIKHPRIWTAKRDREMWGAIA